MKKFYFVLGLMAMMCMISAVSLQGQVTIVGSSTNYTTIQAAINAAPSGSTIYVSPGLYNERIVINKPLTLLGATAGVNKNGYSVPPGYAWNPMVESIISNPPFQSGDPDDSVVVDISATNNVTFEGFIVQSLNSLPNSIHLLRVDGPADNIIVRNNVIGPNTNIVNQTGTNGRMGLYLAAPHYVGRKKDITNSLFQRNKIFDCKGNGNNVFVWGNATTYSATTRATFTDTAIEDNEIYGSHRSGIEIAGSADDLTIRKNIIYNNSGFSGDAPNDLKWGNGIVIIRMGGDKGCPENSAPNTTCAGALGQGPDGLKIENNEIYQNQKNGIYMGPINSNHQIIGNEIRDNGWDGIRLDLLEEYHAGSKDVFHMTTNIVANCNTIKGNTGYGIRIVGEPTNGFLLNGINNWWGAASGPGGVGAGTGDSVSDYVLFNPWLKAPIFNIEQAKIDWKKKPDDDKIMVKGFIIPPACWNGVIPGDPVTFTIGKFTQRIFMDVKDNGKKWEYKRDKGDSGIKDMKLELKKNEITFEIHVDREELAAMSAWTNPVMISLQIGDNKGAAIVPMKEHKDKWEYHK